MNSVICRISHASLPVSFNTAATPRWFAGGAYVPKAVEPGRVLALAPGSFASGRIGSELGHVETALRHHRDAVGVSHDDRCIGRRELYRCRHAELRSFAPDAIDRHAVAIGRHAPQRHDQNHFMSEIDVHLPQRDLCEGCSIANHQLHRPLLDAVGSRYLADDRKILPLRRKNLNASIVRQTARIVDELARHQESPHSLVPPPAVPVVHNIAMVVPFGGPVQIKRLTDEVLGDNIRI